VSGHHPSVARHAHIHARMNTLSAISSSYHLATRGTDSSRSGATETTHRSRRKTALRGRPPHSARRHSGRHTWTLTLTALTTPTAPSTPPFASECELLCHLYLQSRCVCVVCYVQRDDIQLTVHSQQALLCAVNMHWLPCEKATMHELATRHPLRHSQWLQLHIFALCLCCGCESCVATAC
jgi:hypothetical protein